MYCLYTSIISFFLKSSISIYSYIYLSSIDNFLKLLSPFSLCHSKIFLNTVWLINCAVIWADIKITSYLFFVLSSSCASCLFALSKERHFSCALLPSCLNCWRVAACCLRWLKLFTSFFNLHRFLVTAALSAATCRDCCLSAFSLFYNIWGSVNNYN